ncbi:MAG: zf-HC2 domain-containing protein, partial [SAR324 cluster bacterium]|nr:zf-HC2 domain-containing protein [SAR324 cluster bacterium]
MGNEFAKGQSKDSLTEMEKIDIEIGRLIATSGQKKSVPGKCLSAKGLAEFVDGDMEKPEHKEIMAHLVSCPDCYAQFSDVVTMLEETEMEKADTSLSISRAYQ